MTLSAVVAVLLLMLVAGVLVDGLSWTVVRHEALQIAQDAALQAVRAGMDYDAYISGGAVRLDEAAARDRALAVVAQEAGARWAVYDVRVAVLPGPGGGTAPGFPPHPNAGPAPWTSDGPAVGVYLAVPVDSFLLGFLGGVEVHVFAAAEAETQ
jgi:hypothetical protein